jgi:hypothetical protein
MAEENRGSAMPATVSATDTVKFIFLTIGLFLGLGVALAASFRVGIAADWVNRRCDPGVVPLAGLFKPDADPRSRAQFAADNWRSCQKEYVQAALRTATAAPEALAAAQADTVGVVDGITRALTDLFVDLWGFCYEAYSTFMEKIHGVAKLFHNQLIGIHAMVGRLNAAITSIVFGLISMIVAFVSGIQLVVVVVIIIVGILLIMQILMFFLLLPISGLILTISALVMSVAVVVATTVAAVTVGEMFQTGACFLAGTHVAYSGGGTKPIEEVALGDRLMDGGRVTAIHRFWGCDPVYDLHGVQVTGDHLAWVYGDASDGSGGRLIPVAEHPDARRSPSSWIEQWVFGPTPRELWCLTTTSRTIPVIPPVEGRGLIMFADWEEIPLGDTEALRDWHAEVWRTLNGPEGAAIERPMMSALASEAALAADCEVAVQTRGGFWPGVTREGYQWKRVADVRPGDYVATNPTLTHFTAVVGTVILSPDQVTASMELPGDSVQRVSAGTWVWQPFTGAPVAGGGAWAPAMSQLRPLTVSGGPNTVPWHHLYTEAGRFILRGGWRVRDASDVGLEGLAPLVGRVVLKNEGPK